MIEKIRVDCPTCGGTGEIEYGDWPVQMTDCPTCSGSGKVWALPEEKEFDKYDD